MTEKINPKVYFIIKIYTFEDYVKFSFWVSVLESKQILVSVDLLLHKSLFVGQPSVYISLALVIYPLDD